MGCGVALIVLVLLHLVGARIYVRRKRCNDPGFELPAPLRFPVIELAAFVVYFTGALQTGAIVLSLRHDVPLGFIVVAAVLCTVVCLAMLLVFVLVLESFTGVAPKGLRGRIYRSAHSVSALADSRPATPRGFALARAVIAFELESPEVSTRADRWNKAIESVDHKLGSFTAPNEDEYSVWFLATFSLVYDRMTNAVSFFVLEVILSKVILVLLLVTLSGTNGAIQTGLSLALAVLRGALIYVYLPFNAMLSNVRELVTATSHVIIFTMPLLAMYTPLLKWRLVSEFMIITNLGATMFALLLQILSALAIIYSLVAGACSGAAGTAPPAAKALAGPAADVLAASGEAIVEVVVEKLQVPYEAYQETFRATLSARRLDRVPGPHGRPSHAAALAAVKEAVDDGKSNTKSDAVDAAKDAAKGMATEAAVNLVLGAVKDALTEAAVEAIVEDPPTPALQIVPPAVLEVAVGIVVGVTVNKLFEKVLDYLGVEVELEGTELPEPPDIDLTAVVPKADEILEEAGVEEEEDEEEAEDEGTGAKESSARPPETAALTHDPILSLLSPRSRKKAADLKDRRANTDVEAPLPAPPTSTFVVSGDSGARLRAGVEMDSPLVADLIPGTRVVVEERATSRTGVARCRVSSGKSEGWLSAKVLAPADGA